jgi:hypothetical protein
VRKDVEEEVVQKYLEREEEIIDGQALEEY